MVDPELASGEVVITTLGVLGLFSLLNISNKLLKELFDLELASGSAVITTLGVLGLELTLDLSKLDPLDIDFVLERLRFLVVFLSFACSLSNIFSKEALDLDAELERPLEDLFFEMAFASKLKESPKVESCLETDFGFTSANCLPLLFEFSFTSTFKDSTESCTDFGFTANTLLFVTGFKGP